VGGGTLTISALALILNRHHGNFFSVARYAALIAPFAILDDAFVLVLELHRPSRFLNIFRHVNFESPLWIGAWLVAIFLIISTVHAYTYLALPSKSGRLRNFFMLLGVAETPSPNGKYSQLRWSMAIIGLPLGIAVCHYPGFMMSGLAAKPTLLSGVVTGLAAVLLCRVAFKKQSNQSLQREYRENNYLLCLAIIIFLLAELFVLMQLFIFATNNDISLRYVISELVSPGGLMVQEFWVGVIGVGFVIPLATGLIIVLPKLAFSREYLAYRSVEMVMSIAVLIGASMLIYVLLFGGQLTGIIGI
jgi:formate-dependent nitrite reductase membrane component NrfD